MAMILSTGTALNIAPTSGDAGQLGMAVGFDGDFMGRISLLGCFWLGDTLDDFRRSDRFKGDVSRGNRIWGDLYLWFWQFLGFTGCLALGDRNYRRPLHYFSQPSVFQH